MTDSTQTYSTINKLQKCLKGVHNNGCCPCVIQFAMAYGRTVMLIEFAGVAGYSSENHPGPVREAHSPWEHPDRQLSAPSQALSHAFHPVQDRNRWWRCRLPLRVPCARCDARSPANTHGNTRCCWLSHKGRTPRQPIRSEVTLDNLQRPADCWCLCHIELGYRLHNPPFG